jgi:hypothetical protein
MKEEAMRTRSLLAWLVLMALPLAAHAQRAGTAPPPSHRGSGISVTFERESVEEAVKTVISLLPDKPSYAIRGELPDSRVTMRLTNVEPDAALRIVCEAAGLTYQVEPGPGRRVIVVSPTPETAASFAQQRKWTEWWPSANAAVSLPPVGPRFSGDWLLVDLQVEEAPLAEVAAQLARASGYEIVVDEAVPKDIKVTASVRKMPIGDVVALLARQAHLAYSVAYRPSRREVDGAAREVAEAQAELMAAQQKQSRADMEAQLAMAEAEQKLMAAKRAVEQKKAQLELAAAKLEAGLADSSEHEARQWDLVDAEAALEEAQRALEAKKAMAGGRALTVSQVDATQALALAKLKLEQAHQGATLASGRQPGAIVVPAPDSPPVIYLVPAPELRVIGQ